MMNDRAVIIEHIRSNADNLLLAASVYDCFTEALEGEVRSFADVLERHAREKFPGWEIINNLRGSPLHQFWQGSFVVRKPSWGSRIHLMLIPHGKACHFHSCLGLASDKDRIQPDLSRLRAAHGAGGQTRWYLWYKPVDAPLDNWAGGEGLRAIHAYPERAANQLVQHLTSIAELVDDEIEAVVKAVPRSAK